MVILSSIYGGPGRGTILLGLPRKSTNGGKTSLLPHVQCVQARADPSLLGMQPLRTQYGPPLPVAEQLYRILEQKVFHAHINLRIKHYPHDRVHPMLWLLQGTGLGFWIALLWQTWQGVGKELFNSPSFYAQLAHLPPHYSFFQVSLAPRHREQNHHRKFRAWSKTVWKSLWYWQVE